MMSEDYGFWHEVHYDYEPLDSPRGAYDRILSAIYSKGKAAGKQWRRGHQLKCPYVRRDFIEIWELGVFNATENAPLGR